MSGKDSPQIPSWGSPAQGAKWGSPAANLNSSQSNSLPNSPNVSFHTPKFPRHQEPSSFSSRPGNGDSGPQNSVPPIRRHFSTPPTFSPRPLFHSSPMNMNLPSDNKKPRFGQNRNFHGGRGGMSPHGNSPQHPHQKSQSQSPYRRSFLNDSSMSNPGGSSNIEAYYHPSMFEDPWRDMPAIPIKMT